VPDRLAGSVDDKRPVVAGEGGTLHTEHGGHPQGGVQRPAGADDELRRLQRTVLHLHGAIDTSAPDPAMQRRIRTFVAEYNQRYGATVLLTSHYMADVVALCRRVIVIHHGKILYDGDLSGLVD
jgi:ABC-type thiamine transport system ATPase subunit